MIVTPEIVRPMPAGKTPPQLKFPVPFWGDDKLPRTPGLSETGAAAGSARASASPWRQLMQQLKTESEMKLEERAGPDDLAGRPAPADAGATQPQAAPQQLRRQPPAAPVKK